MARHFLPIVLLPCIVNVVTCFQNRFWVRNRSARSRRTLAPLQASFSLPSWLQDALNNVDETTKKTKTLQQRKADANSIATVIRLAARKYDKDASKPSSRDYTTRKTSLESITVTCEGVENDYNHYRTVALKSTPDRAISLLTTDTMAALQASFSSSCRDGDLGENVLLDKICFDDIQVGQKYSFSNSKLVIQVMEPMIPCANLCKLPFVNNDKLTPKQRIEKCQALLEFLDKPGDGFRGWYAKIITPGVIHVGDEFSSCREE